MFVSASIHAEDGFLDIGVDLMDKDGIFAAKMKIFLSCISRSSDDIEEFMKKVDFEVGRSLPSISRTLGQVLKFTKAIMDQFSQVVHLSNLNLIIVIGSLRWSGTPDTRCFVDYCFPSLRGESFYEVLNKGILGINLLDE